MKVEIFYGGEKHRRIEAIKERSDALLAGVEPLMRLMLEAYYDLQEQPLTKEKAMLYSDLRHGGLFSEVAGHQKVMVWENGQLLPKLRDRARIYAMRAFDLAGRDSVLLIETNETKPQRAWANILSTLPPSAITFTDLAVSKESRKAQARRVALELGLGDRLQAKGLEALALACGGEELQLRAALNLLATNAPAGPIRASTIRELLPTNSGSAYGLVDAIVAGDAAAAYRQVQGLLLSGQAKQHGRLMQGLCAQIRLAALVLCCPGDREWKIEHLGVDRRWAYERAERAFEAANPLRVLTLWRAVLAMEKRLLAGTAGSPAEELRRLAALAAA